MNFFFFIFFSFVVAENGWDGWQPEQLHLSWTENINEMQVTWLSWFEGSTSTVYYNIKGDFEFHWATGNATKFFDSDVSSETRFIHRAVLKNLVPGAIYEYQVKDQSFLGISKKYFFQARKRNAKQMKYLVFGDLGVQNSVSQPMINFLGKQRAFDAVLHLGDFAYDLYELGGTRGDEWFQQVESVAASYAYMVMPGNHEFHHNFTQYRNRFSMPMRELNDNLYYSIDVGNVHFVMLDSELYYFDTLQRQTQMEQWLRADLLAANRNRTQTPWIIVMMHRPLYCTSQVSGCGLKGNILRTNLEQMFCEAGVDLVLAGHDHLYQRMLPVYKSNVIVNAPGTDPYNDPPVPIYLVTGAAGNREALQKLEHLQTEWSERIIRDYGVGSLHIINDTHLTFSQHNADSFVNGKMGPPADQLTLIRNIKRQAPHKICD